jgi:hypothetical protein
MSFFAEGMSAIFNCNLQHIDESLGCHYVNVHRVSEEDFFDVGVGFSQEKAVNFIGLRTLMKLGLHLENKGFRLDHNIPWF